MSGLFERLGSAFVAPPAAATEPEDGADTEPRGPGSRRAPSRAEDTRERGGPRSDRAAPPPSVTILCHPSDGTVLGGAVALLLASRCRAAAGLVALWRAPAAPALTAPAHPAARRLVTTLGDGGHDARATGRLAVVRLGEDLRVAAPEAVRVCDLARGMPTAIVLAGPRDESADALLRTQDALLVAVPSGGEAAIADLAVAGLRPLNTRVRAVSLPPAPAPSRALAAAGVAVMPPLRGVLEQAVASLR